jgi:glutaredoxin 3
MDQDGEMIQNALHEKTGQGTVPNIFIGGKHIGGNSDLVTLYQSGELLSLIKEIAISRIKTEL